MRSWLSNILLFQSVLPLLQKGSVDLISRKGICCISLTFLSGGPVDEMKTTQQCMLTSFYTLFACAKETTGFITPIIQKDKKGQATISKQPCWQLWWRLPSLPWKQQHLSPLQQEMIALKLHREISTLWENHEEMRSCMSFPKEQLRGFLQPKLLLEQFFFTWNLSWVLIFSLEFCPLSLADGGSDCLWHPARTVFWQSGVAGREFITALSTFLVGALVVGYTTGDACQLLHWEKKKSHFVCSPPCNLGSLGKNHTWAMTSEYADSFQHRNVPK